MPFSRIHIDAAEAVYTHIAAGIANASLSLPAPLNGDVVDATLSFVPLFRPEDLDNVRVVVVPVLPDFELRGRKCEMLTTNPVVMLIGNVADAYNFAEVSALSEFIVSVHEYLRFVDLGDFVWTGQTSPTDSPEVLYENSMFWSGFNMTYRTVV